MNLNGAIPVLTVMLVTVAHPCDVATRSMPSDQEIPQLEFERRDAIRGTRRQHGRSEGYRLGFRGAERATVYGDAAVSTIRAKFTDILRGKRRTEDQQLTHVWVNLDGRWQLVVRHATRGQNTSARRTGAGLSPRAARLQLMNAPRHLKRCGVGAEATNGRLPHPLRRCFKNQIGIDITQKPCRCLELRFELTGSPASVADDQPRADRR